LTLPEQPERAQDLELEAVLDDLASRYDASIEESVPGTAPEEPGSAAPAPSLGEPADAAEPSAAPSPEASGEPARLPLSAEEIDAVARAVVERLAGEALREVAWEVVPDLAEILIRERLREIEREEHDRG